MFNLQHSEDSAGDSDEEKIENEDSPQWKLLESIKNHLGPNGTFTLSFSIVASHFFCNTVYFFSYFAL